MKKPEIKSLCDQIAYVTPTEVPLSANVVLIEGSHFLWIFDVGIHPAIPEILRQKAEQTGKEIRVILSHFHPDHIANLPQIPCAEIYQGKNTFRYTGKGTIVEKDLCIKDGSVELHLFPVPSSHAKGSLALEVNHTWCFLGDAIYATQKGGQRVYNAERLLAGIRCLKNIQAPWFLPSHAEPFQQKKEEMIAQMEKIYSRRIQGEPYIPVDDK
ncbi:MBL fold metallo-hydrolase [Fusicatenibacter sp.]